MVKAPHTINAPQDAYLLHHLKFFTMLIIFVSAIVFCGGIAVGDKVSKFARNRRKSDALEYLRETGIYPPIYGGYAEQPQPQPQQPQQSTNNVPIFDQFLFIGIVCAVAYAFWCGLT